MGVRRESERCQWIVLPDAAVRRQQKESRQSAVPDWCESSERQQQPNGSCAAASAVVRTREEATTRSEEQQRLLTARMMPHAHDDDDDVRRRRRGDSLGFSLLLPPNLLLLCRPESSKQTGHANQRVLGERRQWPQKNNNNKTHELKIQTDATTVHVFERAGISCNSVSISHRGLYDRFPPSFSISLFFWNFVFFNTCKTSGSDKKRLEKNPEKKREKEEGKEIP